MKERLKELPQIDATCDYDSSLEYANKLLDTLLRFFTLNQIASHTGISARMLSYMRHRGINSFANQTVMEILAGKRIFTQE